MNMKYVLFLSLILITSLFSGCTGQEPIHASQVDTSEEMQISVSQIINGSPLPDIYSCSGPGQVPAVTWKNSPNGTKSVVLILDDPDAPSEPFTHWIVYNCTPDSGGISPDQISISERAGTGYQGINSLGIRGYAPPCPPLGEEHRYVFTLSALDDQITPDMPDRDHIDAAMTGHVLGQAQITALFGR
jgi:Raf kinase inhibitor-like YbhB/YbcL family protein